ncbi:MAG: hypothetical protein AB8B37_02550 [Prochlorococcus sp.]
MGFFDGITSHLRGGPEFDLGTFGDELAYKVEWSPLVGGGTNFTTHRLVKSPGFSRNQIRVETSLWVYLFGGFCIFFTFIIFQSTLGGNATWTVNGVDGPPPSWWPIMALMPASMGCGMIWWFKTKEGIFDYAAYKFTRGSQHFRLDDVHAIQLISERVISSKGGPYRSFELNLVFASGTRINIVDHGSLIALRRDAHMLSEFLRVPVWDVIGFRIGSMDAGPKVKILNQNLRSL